MLTIIPLPTNFTADILSNVGTILGDLSGYITLIISILLAALVLDIIVGFIRHR
jgi:hypothetical protein